ncbi:MAG: hypothetical protein K2M97_03600 [Muribaculaceae bacterium]|nr:hypothetical protein [Muribaculaceae bacterium]
MEFNTDQTTTPDVMPMPIFTPTSRRRISVGLPSGSALGERRFPLTPEGAASLVEKGIDVIIEKGAGKTIHYTDEAYARAGVKVGTRTETMRCNVVISLAAPRDHNDIRAMRRGAILLTLAPSVRHLTTETIRELLRNEVITIAMERIEDDRGNRRVADILHEIDGCASISIASALLADPVHGKGILLGGVTGIVPCEVVVLGSGMGAIAAAHCALGMGATVRMFDDDLYSLRQAGRVLDHRVISSALHPNVLHGAMRSADVIIATPMAHPSFTLGPDVVEMMKRRALVFDLNPRPGSVFPTLPLFNLGEIAERERAATTDRACYFNVGCQVPRTAAMALSNVLISLTSELLGHAGQLTEQSMLLAPGLRAAMLTVCGKAVDAEIAAQADVCLVDPNLLISLS